MTAPALSVVIPTKDREERLHETLAAILEQQDSEHLDLEVLVIDDGSARDLRPGLAALEPAVRFERQAAKGPASARNRGVTLARADRVLFLGDDTRPCPGALAEHLRAADSRDLGVQGLISWDPQQPITDVMRFLAPEGPQFYFRGLEDGHQIPFTALLGSNFSAPTKWLRAEPFDESFPFAAVEDTELAWRWRRRGWHSVFAQKAVCLHHHLYQDLGPFLDRQRRAGYSARYAVRKHPRLLWPLVAQPTLFALVVKARAALGSPGPHHDWDLACRRAFLRGFLGSKPT